MNHHLEIKVTREGIPNSKFQQEWTGLLPFSTNTAPLVAYNYDSLSTIDLDCIVILTSHEVPSYPGGQSHNSTADATSLPVEVWSAASMLTLLSLDVTEMKQLQ